MSTEAVGTAGVLLAHGGGAPEALTVGVPILVLLVFVVLERRARRREREQERQQDG